MPAWGNNDQDGEQFNNDMIDPGDPVHVLQVQGMTTVAVVFKSAR